MKREEDAPVQGVVLQCICSQVIHKTPCLIKLTPVTPKACRRLIFHFISGHMADEYWCGGCASLTLSCYLEAEPDQYSHSGMLDKQGGQADGPAADKRGEKVGQRETSTYGGRMRGTACPRSERMRRRWRWRRSTLSYNSCFLQQVGVCQKDLLQLDGPQHTVAIKPPSTVEEETSRRCFRNQSPVTHHVSTSCWVSRTCWSGTSKINYIF